MIDDLPDFDHQQSFVYPKLFLPCLRICFIRRVGTTLLRVTSSWEVLRVPVCLIDKLAGMSLSSAKSSICHYKSWDDFIERDLFIFHLFDSIFI